MEKPDRWFDCSCSYELNLTTPFENCWYTGRGAFSVMSDELERREEAVMQDGMSCANE